MTKARDRISTGSDRIRCRILTENLVLLAILAALIIGAAGLGYMRIPLADVCRIVVGQWFNLPELLSSTEAVSATVVMDVRLPRIMAAAVVGAGLALSGAVYQGVLLNPLADPFTLGISAGAAFGASVALLFFPAISFFVLPVAAFAGAALTLLAVIFLAAGRTFSRDGISASSLILSGIIVSAILSAGISLLKYLADEQVAIIVFWLMGSFGAKTWLEVGIAAAVVGAGLLIIYCFSRDLNVISLGDRMAASLGVDTKKAILCLLLTASCVAAVCVAISGIIGFVGLLVPHMMRSWTGPDNRRLLPACILAGAILMLGADTVTRAVLPTEIPIGVLTALIGGPVFCWIFRKNRLEGRL